jgi:cytochrome c biogenesis protein CcmG/thiol:disulfide interchange protein DsbE
MLTTRIGTRTSQLELAIFFTLAALAASASSSPAAKDKAPESIAVLDSLTGGSAIAQGSVVYVDFWASWCVPCRQSFPWMTELLRKHGDKGLQVITINLDRDKAAAQKFIGETKASLPVVYDAEGKLAKLYGLEVMPTSFVYARDGSLKLRREGFDPKEIESVERLIRTLIEEKPAK